MRAMTRPPAGLVVAGEEAAPATTERLRLARELHDTIASAIVVVGVQAGVADQALDRGEAGREQAREALRTIRTASRQVLKDLQATVATLRGGSAADGPAPGVAQLDALTSLAGDAGVRVGLMVQGVARRLPPAVDLATYRIVQEALTNVLRHAEPATARVRPRSQPASWSPACPHRPGSASAPTMAPRAPGSMTGPGSGCCVPAGRAGGSGCWPVGDCQMGNWPSTPASAQRGPPWPS
jgi:hypothetical protein